MVWVVSPIILRLFSTQSLIFSSCVVIRSFFVKNKHQILCLSQTITKIICWFWIYLLACFGTPLALGSAVVGFYRLLKYSMQANLNRLALTHLLHSSSQLLSLINHLLVSWDYPQADEYYLLYLALHPNLNGEYYLLYLALHPNPNGFLQYYSPIHAKSLLSLIIPIPSH